MDGPNSGYASLLLEDYLEDPDSVPPEWRAVFESGDSSVVAGLPGLQRLLASANGDRNGEASRTEAPVQTDGSQHPGRRDATRGRRRRDGAREGPSDARSSRGQARSARLRADGRPGARRDANDPVADARAAGADPERLLRVHVPGETLLEALPALKEVYCGTIAYEIEHLSDHAERVWLRQAIESGRYRKPLAAGGAEAASRLAHSRRGVRAVPAQARSSARSSSRSKVSTR